MRVALVHDWLTGMRGGERVLEALCALFPDADLYTLVAFPERLSDTLRAWTPRTRTSFVQRLPRVRSHYRYYLPLFPHAIERFDFTPYDLIVSSSHCVAKGAQPRAGAVHVSYVHTPMRYAWATLSHYFGGDALAHPKQRLLSAAMAPLRAWDQRVSDRVHAFVANSRNVAGRIEACYGRTSRVVYPPIDVARFRLGPPLRQREDFFLVVSALVPYKRVDLAVRAALRAKVRLVVAGEGPELARLAAMGGGAVRMLGRVSDEALASLYARARALVFPGVEDFGMVPVEAMASGTPVLALRSGGALETVLDARDGGAESPTGVFFDAQSEVALAETMARFATMADDFDPAALRRHAERFDLPVFMREMRAAIDAALG